MKKENPRGNGNAMRNMRAWLRACARPCWICREFGKSGRIDYDLPAWHPYSFEVDHLVPVSKWKENGYTSARACVLDKRNVDATHRICNQWRGNKTVEQVKEIAARARGERPAQGPVTLPTSRKW